jgi:cytochrome c-type biogenesis protein CcmH
MKQRRSFMDPPTLQLFKRLQVPLMVVIAIVVLLAALWMYMLLTASAHQTLDQRVYNVASQLKCPVCQGESVADSPSVIALQMRGVIRKQLQSGKSEQEVIQYFVSNYGEQIAWSPPWQGFSLLAWLVPIGLLIGGVLLLFFTLRNWHAFPPIENASNDESVFVNAHEEEIAQYRKQLEQELAAEDPLFRRTEVK